jgi:hypothetical protein
MNEPHRNSCRRHHRVIGQFLAVQAWHRGLDCIVLQRTDLEQFLGLKRFKSERVKWLKADLKPWFKYQEAYYRTNVPSSIHSLFLARVPIASHLPRGSMTTVERIGGMDSDAPRTELFSKSSRKVPPEEDIVSYLAKLTAGLITPDKSPA